MRPVAFDLISLILDFVFMATMIRVLVLAPHSSESAFRRLVTATRLCRFAVGVAVVNLAVLIADPEDGILYPAYWALVVVVAIYGATHVRRRRDAKGEQVVAEAHRTLQEMTDKQ
jgi:hypothetical protein